MAGSLMPDAAHDSRPHKIDMHSAMNAILCLLENRLPRARPAASSFAPVSMVDDSFRKVEDDSACDEDMGSASPDAAETSRRAGSPPDGIIDGHTRSGRHGKGIGSELVDRRRARPHAFGHRADRTRMDS